MTTRRPACAATSAAVQPAAPEPTTTTSYVSSIRLTGHFPTAAHQSRSPAPAHPLWGVHEGWHSEFGGYRLAARGDGARQTADRPDNHRQWAPRHATCRHDLRRETDY